MLDNKLHDMHNISNIEGEIEDTIEDNIEAFWDKGRNYVIKNKERVIDYAHDGTGKLCKMVFNEETKKI